MGGTGSGRIFHFSTKPVLEEYRAIDIRDWKRRRLIGGYGGFAWIWSRNGTEIASIQVWTAPGQVRLSYKFRRNNGPCQDVDENIQLVSTSCNMCGERLWFVCPGCGRRAAKLFSYSAHFRCRKCCGLPYASQMESSFDRAISKREKLRGKLEHLAADLYRKPRGMHHQTFEAITAKIERQEAIIDCAFLRRFGSLDGLL